MTGALWAALSGIGFGIFQSVNQRALARTDIYRATFVQMALAALVLAAAAAWTEDLAQLSHTSVPALVWFALAGLVHFFIGWTLLNESQSRIGAARTSPLLATTPLWGAAIAAVTIEELPTAAGLLGMLAMIAGIYVVASQAPSSPPPPDAVALQLRSSRPETPSPSRRTGPVSAEPGADHGAGDRKPVRSNGRSVLLAAAFGLCAAVSWAVSSVFIRLGLQDQPSPLLGLLVGMAVAVAAYGGVLVLSGRASGGPWLVRGTFGFKLASAVLVAAATWLRWHAIALTQVATVLALSLLSVPTVMVIAALAAPAATNVVTARDWGGAALVMAGALLLILLG